jgi:hypothetical protein
LGWLLELLPLRGQIRRGTRSGPGGPLEETREFDRWLTPVRSADSVATRCGRIIGRSVTFEPLVVVAGTAVETDTWQQSLSAVATGPPVGAA